MSGPGLPGGFRAGTAFVDAEILAFPEGLLEQFMASEPGLVANGRQGKDAAEDCARVLVGMAPFQRRQV
jgi:hypothetical protein